MHRPMSCFFLSVVFETTDQLFSTKTEQNPEQKKNVLNHTTSCLSLF